MAKTEKKVRKVEKDSMSKLRDLFDSEITELQGVIKTRLGANISKPALARMYEDVSVAYLRKFLEEQLTAGNRRTNSRKLIELFMSEEV